MERALLNQITQFDINVLVSYIIDDRIPYWSTGIDGADKVLKAFPELGKALGDLYRAEQVVRFTAENIVEHAPEWDYVNEKWKLDP